MTTYLVRYEIDVDADDEEQAARRAYGYMVQHDSLPPVLEVIPHRPDGQQPRSGTFIDLSEGDVVHPHAEVCLIPSDKRGGESDE